ncbi:hypothetical protein EVAR_24850_1 [Eumeta japonica]|uniref:Uncharacterized protein n=1 Tax=Eumeta variegata TaxID=151549 RepID=A0A4C1YBM2_EUMVA|nr:hypothetical protein EVAR_24850_1 [Eumeta japonica]
MTPIVISFSIRISACSRLQFVSFLIPVAVLTLAPNPFSILVDSDSVVSLDTDHTLDHDPDSCPVLDSDTGLLSTPICLILDSCRSSNFSSEPFLDLSRFRFCCVS